MLMGYLVVTAVLVVPLRAGSAICTGGCGCTTSGSWSSRWPRRLSFDPLSLDSGAVWLIARRVVQGVGGAMLMASSRRSSPTPSRPTSVAWHPANMVSAVAGSFLGLLIGGCSPKSTGRPSSGSAFPGIVGTLWSIGR